MPNKEIKQFSGALNLDDPIDVLGKGFHRDARGIVFKGIVPNRRPEVVYGNVPVENPLLPLSGTNKTISQFYDSKNKRIFFFNYNSTGSHGIYVYNTIPATFQRLVETGVNTSGDPLDFSAESHTNVDILYGDSAQGDILFFIDSNGVPSKINVDRAIAGGYGSIERSFLDVAKEPADIPPCVVYEDDPTVTINNLRKKLFRVKIRWCFDDQDKSITSSQSGMPIPPMAFDQSIDTDPTKNCRLAIVYQTGPSNVKKIEILVSNSLGNVMSDFYLVASLDKAALSIPSNDVATYLFYNDKGYDNINDKESTQLQDYVPQVAASQTFLNGSVPAYGSITEGYPNVTNFSFGSDVSHIDSSLKAPYYFGNTFTVLAAFQNGKSGFGAGDIHIVVRGRVFSPASTLDTYYVYMEDGTNVSYTLSPGDDASAIIAGLRVNALSKGYVIISTGSNDLYINKSGVSLARTKIDSGYAAQLTNNTSLEAYDWLSKYGYGLVYFDSKGRTNGVVYTDGFSVSAAAYTENNPPNDKPLFTAWIFHTPPVWANYFQWVRTNDLTKSKTQQWITDRTFKDTTTLAGQIKYAYVSIESLNDFVEKNPGSPLGYGFTPGDRIRFFKRYNADGSTANLYGDTKNFEVVASLVNPTVNGQVKSGQFIKFILPTTDGNFDFGVSGFANYFIELYTPAQSVASGLNLYYEFGERYAIAYPGTANRFHQGMLQNQIPNTNTPAVYDFLKGDYYIRSRSVQAGNVYTYNVTNGNMTAGRFLFGLTFVDSTYVDPDITAQNEPFANISGNTPSGGIDPGSDPRWFLRSNVIKDFRIQTTLIINFTTSVPGDTWRIFTLNRFNERNYLATFDASAAGTYEFPLDFVQTLEDDRIFLIAEGGERPFNVFSGVLTASIDHVISQRMIDKNFSDYFTSAVNSNGRSWLFDPNANQINYPVMYRYGLAYQTNTSINETNRFYPENFDEANRANGSIMKLAQLGNQLIIFQERKLGHTGVYQRNITNASQENQLITSDVIITPNNVQYFAGEVGVGNQPTSVVRSGYVFYGVDPIKNIIWRLSRDGVTDLSELYKVKTWASDNLPKYLNPTNYQFGGAQKVFGTFNLRPDNIGEYLLLAQGGSSAGETLAFEENNNMFPSKYDVDCDCIVCAENVMYYFRAGRMWKQSSLVFNNFFNVQYTASLLIPFNDQMAVKKNYLALAYQSGKVWSAPVNGDVETDSINSQTLLRQQSRIMFDDFDSLENPNRYASFNKDVNSMSDAGIALWEGDELNGHYILVRLKHAANSSNFLFAPYITWVPLPRNF